MATMTLLQGLFDLLLGLGLLALAWRCLASPDLFNAIAPFISFGLLMALAWVRLNAPDVALAEAAIGAGLTGALLLDALAKLRHAGQGDDLTTGTTHPLRYRHWLVVAALCLVAAALGYVVLSMPPLADGLSREIAAQLDASGVANPVTAVLLNFRGYDTLLEMMVLLLAVIGVWSLGATSAPEKTAPGPMLDTLTRLLIPVLTLVAAYLLWVGADAPGGAFQAGSVLAAAGVMLLLSGWQPGERLTGWPLRLILIAGPGLFIIIAGGLLLLQGELLHFPPQQAGTLILILETSATLSICAILVSLFLGGRQSDGKGHG